MGVERFVEYSEEKIVDTKPATYLKSGPRKGQIKEPAPRVYSNMQKSKEVHIRNNRYGRRGNDNTGVPLQ